MNPLDIPCEIACYQGFPWVHDRIIDGRRTVSRWNGAGEIAMMVQMPGEIRTIVTNVVIVDDPES